MKRDRGYYWVKYFGDWKIGEWYGKNWGQVMGCIDEDRNDSDFDEIDERKIERLP